MILVQNCPPTESMCTGDGRPANSHGLAVRLNLSG